MAGKNALTEQDLLALNQYLNKLVADLSIQSTDHQPLVNLLNHVVERLKEIAWEKYREENEVEEKET